MRYAVLSDLHANRQALQAVLTDIRGIGVDQLICLGDCVGYGPCPAEVLETAYAHVHHFVLGNHDAVIAGRLDPACFNEQARAMIDWTQSELDVRSGAFFNDLPLVVHDQGFSCTHAEFSEPGAFGYIFDSTAALPSFTACAESFLFVGHSHVPGLFVLGGSGVPHWLEPVDFSLESGKRYLINVGSVGQPRDDDVRASYVVFDSRENNLFFRKVPFDLEAYRDDLQRRQVPAAVSYFLQLDSRLQSRPLREMVNFRPARHDEFVPGENDVRTLETSLRRLKKKNLRLLLLSLTLGLLGALATGALGLVASRSPPALPADPGLTVVAMVEPLPSAEHRKGEQILGMTVVPEAGPGIEIGPDFQLAYWNLFLADPEQQRVFIEQDREQVHFRIVSANSEAPIKIYSSAVPTAVGQRLRLRATFLNVAVIRGFAEIYGEYTAADGTVRRLDASVVHQLEELNRWSPRSVICEGFQEGGRMRYVLEAQFLGELRVRDCSLLFW